MPKHALNYDSMSKLKAFCECGHTQAEHEIYHDEHCYKCFCRQFSKKKKVTQKCIPVWGTRYCYRCCQFIKRKDQICKIQGVNN